MFSIKRGNELSEQDDAQQLEELTPAISGLLRAIGQYTPAYDPGGADFRRSKEDLKVQVEQAEDAETAISLQAETVQGLEEHQSVFSRFLAARRFEVKSPLMLLIETVLCLSTQEETTARDLRSMSNEVEQSLEVDTIQAPKTRIAGTLRALCEGRSSGNATFWQFPSARRRPGR